MTGSCDLRAHVLHRRLHVASHRLRVEPQHPIPAARVSLPTAPHGDAFSFADILTARVVQAIAPPDEAYLRLAPPTRRIWTDEALAAEFADLVAWRDRIYEAHRPRG